MSSRHQLLAQVRETLARKRYLATCRQLRGDDDVDLHREIDRLVRVEANLSQRVDLLNAGQLPLPLPARTA